MNKKELLLLLLLIVSGGIGLAGIIAQVSAEPRRHHERWYQDQWCSTRGTTEFMLDDGTRVDCLTFDHAIEFDFANKWYESLGQALYYGMRTGYRPGIVLIIEQESDMKYWNRLERTIRHYSLDVTLWCVTGEMAE